VVVASATVLGRIVTEESTGAEKDLEFDAITAIVRALQPLDEEARSRVLDYSLRRLGLRAGASHTQEPALTAGELIATPEGAGRTPTVHDIRTLREEKQPKSANEMAALVGFYLAHLAPEADQKSDITADDITKYFHDANFPLPGTPRMTLVHARNAGYFDAGARGSYRLNPVGHNLVAHRLPTAKSGGRPQLRARRSKQATSKSGSRKGKSG
jgi:hypothetical protein